MNSTDIYRKFKVEARFLRIYIPFIVKKSTLSKKLPL